ncbi:MAG: glycosyltransferase family 9 protein [Gemmatimonadota bacterium]
MERILVIEYWQLGDVVIALPFLTALRRMFPRARLTAVVGRAGEMLLRGDKVVDEIIRVDVPWAVHFRRWRKYNPFSPSLWSALAVFWRLRRKGFDLGFAGRMDIRDHFLLWLSRARRRVGYGEAGGSFLLTDNVPCPDRLVHRSRLWLRLLREPPVGPQRPAPLLEVGDADSGRASEFLGSRGIDEYTLLVGIHSGARIATRRWGDERFAAVAERILEQFDVKILWFKENQAARPGRAAGHRYIEVVLPMREFMAVLSRCSLLVCNDSGPMHVAAALGVPVVAIFGPQEPAVFAPVGDGHSVVYKKDFECRPCADYCLYDEPYCLREVTVDDVHKAAAAKLREILGKGPHRPGPSRARTGDLFSRPEQPIRPWVEPNHRRTPIANWKRAS